MNVHTRQDCQETLTRIFQLLNCGIFEQHGSRDLLQRSAFIDLMICMRDLLNKLEQTDLKLQWTDDVLVNDKVHNISEAIIAIRDACCHIHSFQRYLDDRGNRVAYNVVYGKGCLMKLDEVEIKCEYEDDAAFYLGNNRLYLKRHILRVFNEGASHLTPLMQRVEE